MIGRYVHSSYDVRGEPYIIHVHDAADPPLVEFVTDRTPPARHWTRGHVEELISKGLWVLDCHPDLQVEEGL